MIGEIISLPSPPLSSIHVTWTKPPLSNSDFFQHSTILKVLSPRSRSFVNFIELGSEIKQMLKIMIIFGIIIVYLFKTDHKLQVLSMEKINGHYLTEWVLCNGLQRWHSAINLWPCDTLHTCSVALAATYWVCSALELCSFVPQLCLCLKENWNEISSCLLAMVAARWAWFIPHLWNHPLPPPPLFVLLLMRLYTWVFSWYSLPSDYWKP